MAVVSIIATRSIICNVNTLYLGSFESYLLKTFWWPRCGGIRFCLDALRSGLYHLDEVCWEDNRTRPIEGVDDPLWPRLSTARC